MTRQDFKIREGLIALMCVGDTIRYLNSEMVDARERRVPTRGIDTITNTVRKYIIEEIDKEKEIIKVVSRFTSFYQHLDAVDEYEGELYIWNAAGLDYNDWEHEKRVAKMVALLESKHTKYIE